MAAWASGDLQNVHLQSFTSSRGSPVHHVKERHLSIEDIHSVLAKSASLNASGKRMLEILENLEPHDFQLAQREFPVSHLQHVTDEASMEKIYKQEGFKTGNQSSRPVFKDLSFWSAVVDSEDVEFARHRSYEEVGRVLSPMSAQRHKDRIKEQFGNSPAFNEYDSRYGNFKFSFPLFSLLDMYQAQHCGGGEPQLRILGTDLFRQEIAHYVLVHSPDRSDEFRSFPMVPTVEGSCDLHPFVYRKRGMLYWRPDSTSSDLTVKFSEEGIARRECPAKCEFFGRNDYCVHIREENYGVQSAWNHLVFAFHLPNGLRLKAPQAQLLRFLTPCCIDEPALLEESKCLEIEEAEDIIREKKSDFRRSKRMRTC